MRGLTGYEEPSGGVAVEQKPESSGWEGMAGITMGESGGFRFRCWKGASREGWPRCRPLLCWVVAPEQLWGATQASCSLMLTLELPTDPATAPGR